MKLPRKVGVGFQRVWLVLLVGTVALAVWGLGLAYNRPQLVAFPGFIDFMVERGLSVQAMMVLGLITPVVLASVVAIVIFLGRRDDRTALLFALALVFLLAWGSGATLAIRAEVPGWVIPIRFVEGLWLGIGIVGLATFPNGRFASRWAGWAVAGALVGLLALPDASVALRSIGNSSGDGGDQSVAITLFVLYLVVMLVVVQTSRYRRHFADRERRQSRLVLLAVSLTLIPIAAAVVATVVGASLSWLGWALMAATFVSWLIPVAVGVAIFRYRLYDVDRIVSLSLSYVVVVALVAAIYGAGVILLRQLIPGEGDLPVAASTLAVAALFNPLRRRVRAAVDKRFHRSRYDAELILAGFADRLHRRVDLEGMIDESVAIVQATMNPSLAAMWLPEVAGRR